MSRFFSRTLLPFKGKPHNRPESDPQAPALSAEESAKYLAKQSTAEARHLVNQDLASKLGILPLRIITKNNTQHFECAAGTAEDSDLVQALRFATGMPALLIETAEDLIEHGRMIAYLGDDKILEGGLIRAINSVSHIQNTEIQAKDFVEVRSDAAAFLRQLLEYACARCATDLTFTPRRENALLRMRINGELYSQGKNPLPIALHSQLVSRIKILAALDITQRSKPQDGRFTFQVASKQLSIRVGILPTLHGESVALRLLGTSATPQKLSELGLSLTTEYQLKRALTKRSGIIVFSGPTGSGKTTTMYASILKLLENNLRVVTVEDPIEIEVADIVQSAVNEKQGLSYVDLLRSVLRHDPDAILIGEIRDKQSAEVAFQAAHTGHLILTTTHARNAGDVFVRFEQLGVPPYTIAESTLLVVSQRLLPKLCDHCKVIDLNVSRSLAFTAYRPVGCDGCDYTGFKGRKLITESLVVQPELKELLSSGTRIAQAVEATLDDQSFKGLYSSLQDAVRAGEISFEQMMNFVECDPGSD